MKIYTIYAKESDSHPMENMILIKEGFSWRAAILHLFWAFYNKMWAIGGILLAVNLLFSVLEKQGYIPSGVVQSMQVGVMLFVGCNFNDWYRQYLEKQGYSFCGVVGGKDVDDASSKYMSEMLQRTTFVSGQGR
jgi:hypothetical protein